MSSKTQEGVTTTKRKTLMERQAETKVADPAAHAKKQVAELDKTAKRSLAKRKFVTEQLEKDRKEIEHIENQISRINERYLPLCEHLKECKEKKANLTEVLALCIKDEKKIMTQTISIVQERKMDDSKLLRTMAKNTLAVSRGFTLAPESTFHQTGHNTLRNTGGIGK